MKSTLLLAAGLLLALNIAAPADDKKGPVITGNEVLLEAVDKNGQLGIYALDVFDAKTPQLRLLVKGGSSPKWSLQHRKFFFTKNQMLAIYEQSGDQKAWWARTDSATMSSPVRFEQGRMEWDYVGKASYIENNPAFGAIFSRSMSLSEKLPLTRENPALNGFRDTIIPLLDGVPQSIGSASVSPDEKLLAAQVYPAMPQNAGSGQSRIRLYDMFYHLGKTDPQQWRQKMADNYQQFVATGISPQIAGPGQEIGSPTLDCIDIEPRFSPTGKYIAFNRINTKEKTMRPMIVEVAAPQVAYPIENPAWAEHVSTHPDQVWGRQNFRAIEWDAEQDQLWIVSGDERLVNKVDMQDASWQFLRLDTQTERARPPLQTAFKQNHIIGVWAGWPQQLMLFKMETENKDASKDKTEAQYYPKPARTLTLPEGFTVRRVEW